MRLTATIFLLLLAITLNSCKQETKVKQAPIEEKTLSVQELTSPASTSSSLPHLVSNKGVTLLSWVEKEGDSMASLKYAELRDNTWQESVTITKGGDWFLNWADYPMIAENKGNLWSHILKKSTAGTYSYDIKMNSKPRGAAEWTTHIDLHTDGTPTEHGFVSVLPYQDSFFVNWLDGRNTLENETGERGAMTLRAGMVSASGALSDESELDARTCDCCQTTSAITNNGPVLLYRDRTEDEIRDISIVRQVDGKWSNPKVIHEDNWKINGCPVNGPKAAALENNLVVAWFTAAQQNPRVQLVFSEDAGENFQEPIVIADEDVMGRVDVLWINEETAAVSWMESTKDKRATFNVVKATLNGEVSKKQVITEMDGSRKSGFPQMEIDGKTLYFAWTDYSASKPRVKTAMMSLENL